MAAPSAAKICCRSSICVVTVKVASSMLKMDGLEDCSAYLNLYQGGNSLVSPDQDIQEANMKVIGVRPTSFTGNEKKEVRGANIYVMYTGKGQRP